MLQSKRERERIGFFFLMVSLFIICIEFSFINLERKIIFFKTVVKVVIVLHL